MTTAQGGCKVVSLTHRPHLPPGNSPGSHFCQRLSRPQGHSTIGRIMSMKNYNDTIWNRNRDLPICKSLQSIVVIESLVLLRNFQLTSKSLQESKPQKKRGPKVIYKCNQTHLRQAGRAVKCNNVAIRKRQCSLLYGIPSQSAGLTLWRRIFFLIFAHSVYKT